MWILNSYRDKSWVLRECEHAIDPRRDINSTSISALNYPWSWNFNVARSTFIVQLLIGCFQRKSQAHLPEKPTHIFRVIFRGNHQKSEKNCLKFESTVKRGVGFSDLRPINSDYRLINERVTGATFSLLRVENENYYYWWGIFLSHLKSSSESAAAEWEDAPHFVDEWKWKLKTTFPL